MCGLDSPDKTLSFYSPDSALQLRYPSQPVDDCLLATKQLFPSYRFSSSDLPLEDVVEKISQRDQREKSLEKICFKDQKPLCSTSRYSASDFLMEEDMQKIFSRDQRDNKSMCSTEPLETTSDPQKTESSKLDETDSQRVQHNQDREFISVINSSLSQLSLTQQGLNSSNAEPSASRLNLASDSLAQRMPVSRQLPDDKFLRSNYLQNSQMYSTWDNAPQQPWNQQHQYGLSQHVLQPSINANNLAAAISRLHLSSSRMVQPVGVAQKMASDVWMTDELVNGLNLQQSQPSARFDAQKLPVMNQDLLDIFRSPDHLKRQLQFDCLDDGSLLNSIALDQIVPNIISPIQPSSVQLGLQIDHYSRKVFVGGLPPDIAEEEITQSFRKFGPLVVDWPHKAESKSYFPPKGYCFLLFQDEMSVQALINSCVKDDGKLYWSVSSPTIKDKPVQIRPWNLADSDFVMDGSQPLDPRKTIFVGGVPRPLRAVELAVVMNRLYGGVCYAGIDTDPELKYPKGAGRVAFSNQQSYIAAISARFVQLQHADIDKRVEVKPYVLDDQLCDECQGVRCGGKFAPYFCANVACLQYYCEHCWSQIHSRPGREFHKPLVKEGADRPRTLPFRWC